MGFYFKYANLIETDSEKDKWIIPIILILSIIFYNAIGGLFVKCPKCKNKLKMQGHKEDIHSKADCLNCSISWDLGVAFKTKQHNYHDE